jgi:hypothetical protein
LGTSDGGLSPEFPRLFDVLGGDSWTVYRFLNQRRRSWRINTALTRLKNAVTFLGYDPEWQDIFGTEEGDLRAVLRRRIDSCKGVVQLVGKCYGAEPPSIDEQFGRVSYTQYEALYASSKGKKVWYLFLDESFPTDPHEVEEEEKEKLQSAYRARLKADIHLYRPLGSREGLEWPGKLGQGTVTAETRK